MVLPVVKLAIVGVVAICQFSVPFEATLMPKAVLVLKSNVAPEAIIKEVAVEAPPICIDEPLPNIQELLKVTGPTTPVKFQMTSGSLIVEGEVPPTKDELVVQLDGVRIDTLEFPPLN